MRGLLLFLLMLMTVATQAQERLECGTVVTPEQRALLSSFHLDHSRARLEQVAEISNVAITVHLVRRSDGTGGLTASQLGDALDNVNDFYANAGLSFFILGEINYIDNSTYYNFITSQETALGAANDVANTINIYFVNSVGDGEGASFCGYAYFPNGPDRILMDNACAINGSTLPHEIGHYFTLYHTHGKVNGRLTDELVDGSNCQTAGDEVCDTPADPQIGLQNISGSCTYNGTTPYTGGVATDANGDLFAPDPNNIMSYAPKQCRDTFSSNQYSRMAQAFTQFRSYLISQSVVADFEASSTSACIDNAITFADKSIGATGWQWVFPGGAPSSSTEQHPQVSYSTAGNYDVTLIAENDGTYDTLTRTTYIEVIELQQVNFTEASSDWEGASQLTEQVINPDNGITFELTDVLGQEANNAVRIDFFNYQAAGEVDYLVIPRINTSVNKDLDLSFTYAYAPYSDNLFDGLEIVYREDCDSEWLVAWSKFGANLATVPAQQTQYFPGSNDWLTVNVSLSASGQSDIMQVAFRGVNGWGNNLYLLDYMLTPMSTAFVNLMITVTDVSCAGESDGQAMASIEGSQDLMFSLDNQVFDADSIFSNLASGSYTLFVKNDFGGIISKSFVVDAPDELMIDPLLDHPYCTDE
ncbi:MAG: hypothetical protein KI790_05415, partial [Cyclobacteriaceae bacterium]|nr:hypothetical protein [Cyclobacteriaceae bacterium HetDA_MAG_MS6]